MVKSKKTSSFRIFIAVLAMLAVTFTALAFSGLLTGKIPYIGNLPQIPPVPSTLHGLTVRTGRNGCFPLKPNLPTQEQKKQLDELISFANNYGYNSIFFEAATHDGAIYHSSILQTNNLWTTEKTSFDPLDYLTYSANEQGLQVYAVISPLSDLGGWLPSNKPELISKSLNKDALTLTSEVSKELLKKYPIAGILLDGSTETQNRGIGKVYGRDLVNLLSEINSVLPSDSFKRIGAVVDFETISSENTDYISSTLSDGTLNFIVTSYNTDTTLESKEFMSSLSAWKKLCTQYSADFYTTHSVNDDNAFSHTAENRMYLENQIGSNGAIIDNYGSLNTEKRTAAYILSASFSQYFPENMPNFSYSQTFSITRPTKSIVLGNAFTKYFITGTSVPGSPIIFEENELENVSPGGLWGVLVDVEYGKNTYSFLQDGVTKTVEITRNKPSSAIPIDSIIKSTTYPTAPEVVLVDNNLKLSCQAPSGGTVTASVGGLEAQLHQVSAAEDGVAVLYQASFDVSSLGIPGLVKNVGPVTYRMNYHGMNSSQQSAENVYVVGENASPTAKMKTFVAPININPADDGLYSTVLRDSCVDTILENVGSYYKLSMGGYILKSAVEIQEGNTSSENLVSKIMLEETGKGEKIVISGSVRPAFIGNISDNSLNVTIYNISGWENMNLTALKSNLCDAISSTENADGSVTITFSLKSGVKLLGWDVIFEGTDMSIYLKPKPTLKTDTSKPLTGITVVLDPGHGGNDSGAMGTPGSDGPAENLLNLANSYILRSRLEALGASVQIVQENITMTLNERMELSQKYDADIFISSHHNSLSEIADANTVSGIEVYYWNDQSKLFAEQIGENLAEQTLRRLRFTQQSWYRVTMMTACPSVLVESGYICNPKEYDSIADNYAMYRYGNAVADAVLQYFTTE